MSPSFKQQSEPRGPAADSRRRVLPRRFPRCAPRPPTHVGGLRGWRGDPLAASPVGSHLGLIRAGRAGVGVSKVSRRPSGHGVAGATACERRARPSEKRRSPRWGERPRLCEPHPGAGRRVAWRTCTLRRLLPKRYWIEYNELMVSFGQTTCRPISPWCSRCPVLRSCPQIGVTTRR